MVPPRYNRSFILNFNDLDDTQQAHIRDIYFEEKSDAFDNSYVLLNKEPLPLAMFMRIENSIWDGVYGTSAFSAYFIKISKCGTEAVVAERFC